MSEKPTPREHERVSNAPLVPANERPMAHRARQAMKRVRCWLTLNHIDPGVFCVGQYMTACKRCGKVWRVWG